MKKFKFRVGACAFMLSCVLVTEVSTDSESILEGFCVCFGPGCGAKILRIAGTSPGISLLLFSAVGVSMVFENVIT